MTSDLSSALEVCIDEMRFTNRRLLYFTLLYFESISITVVIVVITFGVQI